MIGEAQGESFVSDFALLGWPLRRRLDDLQPPSEQVVDRPRRGHRRVEAEAVAQLGEERPVLGGPKVEVAAEQQRRVGGPSDGGPRSEQHILSGHLRMVVGRMKVRDAEPGSGAGEGHRPPFWLSPVDSQLPPLHDLPQTPVPAEES
jgi:hypothetical protein